jgi:hypothetical protein
LYISNSVDILCGLEGFWLQGCIIRRNDIMRISILVTAVALAASTLIFGCGEKDEDTGDTSAEEAVDTAGEETE